MVKRLVDTEIENCQLELNRGLLYEYGSKLVVSSIREVGNKLDIKLNYNKIFHIIDEKKKAVYIRNLRFENVFETDLKRGEKLTLPLDEINSAIELEYSNIRKNIIHGVLSDKDLILKLINNTHLFSAFLNKFYTITNELVIKDKLDKDHINQLIENNPNYEKYLNLIVDMSFAEFNSKEDLVATNELKLLLKKNNANIRNTVNEVIFKIVKENYDYIVYDLNIFTLKTYVTTVSCLFYLFRYHKLKNIKINISDFFKSYTMLYKKVNYTKFVERINNLVYSGVLNRENNLISLAT